MDKKEIFDKLPKMLQDHYEYIADCGHCIMGIPKVYWEISKEDPYSYEAPVPVKYVLENGYKEREGFLLIDIDYNSEIGLVVDEEYYTY